jgi:hypothetical protein
MLNRLHAIIQRIEQLKVTIANSKGSQKLGAELALKSDINKFNRFGSHHTIVRASVTTPSGKYDIYYTDITEIEATEYTRIKYPNAQNIEAHAIPVGKPIYLSLPNGK